jgi:peroxiredoxin
VKRKGIWLTIFVVALLAGYALLTLKSQAEMIKDVRDFRQLQVSSQLPPLTLEAADGSRHTLEIMGKGQKVLFVLTTTCQVCKEKAQYFDQFAAYLKKQNIEPYVLYQDPNEVKFKTFQNMTAQYRLLDDQLRLTSKTPTVLLLDSSNRILEMDIGYDFEQRFVEKRTHYTDQS